MRRSATWATAEAFDILSREDHNHTCTLDRLQVSCKTTVNGYFCKGLVKKYRGVGRSREGEGHEVLSLVLGVGRAIFSYPQGVGHPIFY